MLFMLTNMSSFTAMRQPPLADREVTKGNCFPTLRDEGTLPERHRNLMTYPEAIRFLYDLRWFGTKLGLTNTFKLAALTGHPQRGLNFHPRGRHQRQGVYLRDAREHLSGGGVAGRSVHLTAPGRVWRTHPSQPPDH